MALLLSEVFSDEGSSAEVGVLAGDAILYTVDLSNDFDGKLYLMFTEDGQSYSRSEIAADATGVQLEVSKPGRYYFKCELVEETLTGTATVSMNSVDKVLSEVKDLSGAPKFQVTEGGLVVNGNQTSEGVGAINGSTVSVVEKGNGVVHQSVITLSSTPVSVVSVTTGNGVGGTKIYDFPAGHIRVLGCVGDLSLAVETEDDFTDSTPSGDVGIGSVAPANADALGTDATDDDYGTSTAFDMVAYADASVVIPPEDALNLDGTSTAKDVYVNVLVDAADIDNDATTNVLVSGTVKISWMNLGDY